MANGGTSLCHVVDFYWYTGLAVLLLTLLALNISRLRISNKVANGDGDNLTIKKAIRAHGNALEHTMPFGMAILALALMQFNTLYLAVLVFGFLAVRVLHAYSMLSSAFNLRRFAAASTYLFELLACGFILAAI